MEEPRNDDGRIGAALIRVALALRADPKADFNKVVQKTALDMDLDVNFLRQYVTKSLSTLRSAVAHAVPLSTKGPRRPKTAGQMKP